VLNGQNFARRTGQEIVKTDVVAPLLIPSREEEDAPISNLIPEACGGSYDLCLLSSIYRHPPNAALFRKPIGIQIVEEFSIGRFNWYVSFMSIRGDLNRISTGDWHFPDLARAAAL
jgi:hypothetical protein